MSTFNHKQESELKKEIFELIKKGFTYAPIRAVLDEKFDYLRDKDKQSVTNFIDEKMSSFLGINFIQRVKKSKIIAPNNSKNWFLYSPITKMKEMVLESNIVKLCLFEWKANLLPCILSYLPFTNEDIIYGDEGSVVFNTYQPPAWYKGYHYNEEKLEENKTLPSVYEKFFNHLFSSDIASIEYVLDWMANALKGKNECYLTAISQQGTGKGTLGDIFMALVGASNYVTMGFNSITKQFNSQIEDKKIIYFDEVLVQTTVQENILKILVNHSIEVERKHQDAKTVKNYASLYLSSNDMASLKMKSDDRRYSIVVMTNTKYNSRFTTADRAELFLPQNIKDLGIYLLNRSVDKDKMTEPFLSNHTKLVKEASLADWEDSLLNSLAVTEAGKKLSLKVLRDKLTNETGKVLNIGNKAIKELRSKFPNFFEFKREYPEDGSRIFVIEFYPLAAQPRHLLENIEVSGN